MLIEITDKNFHEVISRERVIIDFWAPWCGPCKMISPTIEEIHKEEEGVTVGKLNVDDYPELAGRHGVMSIPTLLFFKDGELMDSSIGVVSKNVILNKLAALA
ncbi:MAG: thioredoxin [Candidatus Cloacimonetes bacterium]|nr:thioredoxin [Candidatus Cloacimonadota bacterium]MCB5286269.1 thioredoxin [Candidatus Cloacimonadota bacterium]MCK9184831.1 thioredoxin [Candidatus Cloacimonadota bacterium]MCK9584087.1 thioredoxin [Candidatus Cloacimonadota bacterium]MDY0228591.1 thioredoxin [Candidatus Cloacimonadaceae bacterium]